MASARRGALCKRRQTNGVRRYAHAVVTHGGCCLFSYVSFGVLRRAAFSRCLTLALPYPLTLFHRTRARVSTFTYRSARYICQFALHHPRPCFPLPVIYPFIIFASNFPSSGYAANFAARLLRNSLEYAQTRINRINRRVSNFPFKLPETGTLPARVSLLLCASWEVEAVEHGRTVNGK